MAGTSINQVIVKESLAECPFKVLLFLMTTWLDQSEETQVRGIVWRENKLTFYD